LVNESNSNKLLAVFINSYLPHCLADLFNNTNTKIIHLSTGGVFSGNDEHNYEDCITSPQSYYGITKAAGEFVNDKDLVVRSDFWGFDSKINGTGIFNWFLNQNGIVNGFSNVFFNGISNLEFSKIFLDIINYSGIIHIGSESKFSKGNFLYKVKEIFKLEHISLVQKKNIYKNIFLKSKYNIPKINNLDTMLNDVYCYLLNNQQYYNNIYPHIYKEH
jgi:dTDP-4-dehydrorhamnose reductase